MDALILVDLQNDFMPGGALAVEEGDKVVPIANQFISLFKYVILTQDWHPQDHQSFASQHKGKEVGELIQLEGLDQVLWPDHCVQGSPGAEFHKDLNLQKKHVVFQKGTQRKIDSYSGFFDNGHNQATGLEKWLKDEGITGLIVMGLATDYCVKFTVLDALEAGFKVTLITDACRGVDLQPGDVEAALQEMEAKGAKLTDSSRWFGEYR